VKYAVETQTWIMSTDKGEAILVLPAKPTAPDLADLGEWFSLILRSLLRQHEALRTPQAADAVDPHAGSTGKPSTRD
jgi:hypothetical protein